MAVAGLPVFSAPWTDPGPLAESHLLPPFLPSPPCSLLSPLLPLSAVEEGESYQALPREHGLENQIGPRISSQSASLPVPLWGSQSRRFPGQSPCVYVVETQSPACGVRTEAMWDTVGHRAGEFEHPQWWLRPWCHRDHPARGHIEPTTPPHAVLALGWKMHFNPNVSSDGW